MNIDRRDLFKWVAGGGAAVGLTAAAAEAEANAAPRPVEKQFPSNDTRQNEHFRLWDVVNWALFDTFDSQDKRVHAFGKFTLFSRSRWEQGCTNLTNMTSPQRLDPPKQFRIERIFITFSEDSPAVRRFTLNSTLRILVGCKYMAEAPLEVFGVVKHSPLITLDNLHPSGICPPGALVFTPLNAIHIDSGCNFFAEIETEAREPETHFTGRVYLDGQMARGVQ